MTTEKTTKKTAKILFVFYLVALAIRQIGFLSEGSKALNLIPFSYTKSIGDLIYVSAFPLIPMGMFLKGLYKEKDLKDYLSFTTIYLIIIESLQYAIMSCVADITDIIVGLVASLIGVYIYKFAELKLKDKTSHMMTMLASIVCGVVIAVFIGKMLLILAMVYSVSK